MTEAVSGARIAWFCVVPPSIREKSLWDKWLVLRCLRKPSPDKSLFDRHALSRMLMSLASEATPRTRLERYRAQSGGADVLLVEGVPQGATVGVTT